MSSKHFLSFGLLVLLLGTVSASILGLVLGSTGKNNCKSVSNPCPKGRLCVNVIGGGYACTCVTGFLGTNCDIRDACNPNPCVRGTCHLRSLLGLGLFSTYVCNCNTGYTGTTCNKKIKGKPNKSSEEDDTDTEEPPVKTPSQDLCNPNPCVHGACSSGDYGAQCACENGWIGKNCDTIDNCASNPCSNGGVCNDEVDAFTCLCPDGWTGAACETRDYCCQHPCVNNGTCVNGQSGYTCSCATGWTGTNCDTPDPCNPNPCAHGTCTKGSSGANCQCEADWTGPYCFDQPPPLTYGDM